MLKEMLLLQAYFAYLTVIVLAGIELTFFVEVFMMPCLDEKNGDRTPIS